MKPDNENHRPVQDKDNTSGQGAAEPGSARAHIEGQSSEAPPPGKPGAKDGKPTPADDHPPAGPHARAGLTNDDATPGSGAMPSSDSEDDVEAGSG